MSDEPKDHASKSDRIELSDPLEFPAGLPGFEEHKQFIFESKAEMRPFLWLRSVDDPEVALPVISCLLLKKQVQLHISKKDLSLIGSPAEGDIAPYYILRVDSKEGTITANTKAPVIINTRSMQGRQIILERDDLVVDEPLTNLVPSGEGG